MEHRRRSTSIVSDSKAVASLSQSERASLSSAHVASIACFACPCAVSFLHFSVRQPRHFGLQLSLRLWRSSLAPHFNSRYQRFSLISFACDQNGTVKTRAGPSCSTVHTPDPRLCDLQSFVAQNSNDSLVMASGLSVHDARRLGIWDIPRHDGQLNNRAPRPMARSVWHILGVVGNPARVWEHGARGCVVCKV